MEGRGVAKHAPTLFWASDKYLGSSEETLETFVSKRNVREYSWERRFPGHLQSSTK